MNKKGAYSINYFSDYLYLREQDHGIYFIFYVFLFYFGGGCVCIAGYAGINSRNTIRNRGDGATRRSYLEFSLTEIVR